MKTNKFALLIACAFAFVLLAGFASAVVTVSGVPSTLSKSGGSFDITVSSDMNETVSLLVSPNFIQNNGKNINFTLSKSSLTLNLSNSSEQVTINYIVDSDFNFEFGKEYSTVLSATGTLSGTASGKLVFEKSSEICEYTNIGNDLSVDIRDVSLIDSRFGEDDQWYPFSNVEVELRIENDGDDDMRDVSVEWGLWSTETNEWIIELDEEDEFNIKDGDSQSITFTLTIDDGMDVDLEDLEDGTYILYVRATGKMDEGVNEGDFTCSSDFYETEIVIERDFVILSDIEIPETVQCGSSVRLSADVWNIGSRDQDDVYVKIYNRQLGIDERVDIGNIDSFDSESLNFDFGLPGNMEGGKYSLTISVYDEDDDTFENSDDDSSVFDVSFIVSESCSLAKATVSAVLQSGGKAGQQMVVKSTITNSGTDSSDYILNVAGYTEWADSAALEQSSFSLNSGESKNVLITFDVNSEAEGDKLFTLEVLSGNTLVASQPVQITIQKSSSGITGFVINRDNWHIWGIGLLNLILVIVIIIIAVRIARR